MLCDDWTSIDLYSGSPCPPLLPQPILFPSSRSSEFAMTPIWRKWYGAYMSFYTFISFTYVLQSHHFTSNANIPIGWLTIHCVYRTHFQFVNLPACTSVDSFPWPLWRTLRYTWESQFPFDIATSFPLSVYPEVGELDPLAALFQLLDGYRELLSTSLITPSGFRTGLLG